MVYFSPCKINIGLKVINKRTDGFHNLETIFYNIPFYDVIEIISSTVFTFIQTGIQIPSNGKENLCVSAYKLFKIAYPNIPNVSIQLHKTIPAGAGLGGGSANASTILNALNSLFNCNAPQSQLLQMALALGSDCPFFILNTPCLGQSRGEELTPIKMNLKGFFIHIINPQIHISTADAFAALQLPTNNYLPLSEAINLPIENWKNTIENDFEKSVFPNQAEIENIKNTLYKQGAIYASMTGTGSTVFGIFKLETSLFNWPKHYLQKAFMLEI